MPYGAQRGGAGGAVAVPPRAREEVSPGPSDASETGVAPEVLAGAAIGAAGGMLIGAASGGAARAVAGALMGGLAGAGVGYVSEVRGKYGLTRGKFARAANVSERTLAEWEKGRVPDEKRLRAVHELNRLFEALVSVVDPKEVGPWMERPNEAFDGLKPLELVERGQTDRIWRMIYFLESGSPS